MWARAASSRPRASCRRRTEATRGSSRPGTRERGRDTVLSLTGQVQYSHPLRSTLARLLPVGWGWGPRGLHTQDTACHHAKPWVYAETQRRERGGRKEAESMREGVRAVPSGDGWPWVPAQASEAAGSRIQALTFPQRLVTSHPPPPQDAAGPPGPLCASSAARLRLAGSPVRQHPRRAKSPEPSGIVVAPTRSPEARSARPCP